jgi:glycosyltransferase involved in cell wall biosynthesis
MPRVTVAVPVHNGERYLRQALQSIVDQTYHDWEAVVVDDASSDGSRALATKLADRHPGKIRLLSLDRNVGVAQARNVAVRASQGGELVALLDQDDYWREDYLARTTAMFDLARSRGARPGIIACNALIQTPDGPDGTFADQWWWRDEIDLNAMIERNQIIARAVFSRPAFEQVGGFCTECGASDDYDLWLRIMQAGYQVVTTREPLVVYRIHPEAQSRNQRLVSEGAIATYRRLLEGGALTPRQQRMVRARIRHYRALRERAMVRAACAERRHFEACLRASRGFAFGLVAFLQSPSRWAEWIGQLLGSAVAASKHRR